MQKIIEKFYNGKQAIASSVTKKTVFVSLAVILPWIYYIFASVIIFVSSMGVGRNFSIDVSKSCFLAEWLVYLISPLAGMPFYTALAFFAVLILLKNPVVKILMGILYVYSLLIQSVVIMGMTYVYEILYLAGPHLVILLAGIFIAIKLKLYERNKAKQLDNVDQC